MELKPKRRATWEVVVVVLLVSCSMLLSMALYSKRDQVAKERLLILELQTLRNRVMTYMLENKKRPSGVTDNPVDPFGNPYHYNPKTGRVSTTTSGYLSW